MSDRRRGIRLNRMAKSLMVLSFPLGMARITRAPRRGVRVIKVRIGKPSIYASSLKFAYMYRNTPTSNRTLMTTMIM
jgi:hypothetical protein